VNLERAYTPLLPVDFRQRRRNDRSLGNLRPSARGNTASAFQRGLRRREAAQRAAYATFWQSSVPAQSLIEALKHATDVETEASDAYLEYLMTASKRATGSR